MKKLVSAYFVGYMRFSSAVIFSRCSSGHLKTARYYYSMALAAAVGLNTAEALSLSCCKQASVKEDNAGYKKLLQLTGLPSIREMACLDSVSLIKQTAMIRPQWFVKSTARVSRSQKDGKPRIIGVIKDIKGTLLDNIFDLKDEYMLNFKPKRDQIFKEKEKVREHFKTKIEKLPRLQSNKFLTKIFNERKMAISKIDTPILSEYYIARDICTYKGRVDYDLLLRTFTLNSRSHFNCLDTVQRVRNFKTPTRSSMANNHQNQLFNGNASTQTQPDISALTPSRKRPPDKDPNQQLLPQSKRRKAILRCDEWVGSNVFCKFCKVKLDTGNNESKSKNFESHLLYFCKNIPGKGPLKKTKNLSLAEKMRRLSEIAAIPDNND